MLSYSFAAVAFLFFAGTLWLALNHNSSQFTHNNELASVQTPSSETEIQKTSSVVPVEEQKSADKANAESETSKDKTSAVERLPKVNRNQSSPKNRIEQPKKSAAIFSTIILPLGLTRGDSSTFSKSFDIPAKADFLNLQLKFEEGEFTSYFAVLETVEG